MYFIILRIFLSVEPAFVLYSVTIRWSVQSGHSRLTYSCKKPLYQLSEKIIFEEYICLGKKMKLLQVFACYLENRSSKFFL